MPSNCQACERLPSTLVKECDTPEIPYRVCEACHRRLLARALRPLEWYNLAKRKGGGQFLLHDDFYGDNGEATQPEEDVEAAADFPAPTLAQCSSDAELLLDYSITRWVFEADLVKAWRELSLAQILPVLTNRLQTTASPEVRAVALRLASLTLGAAGAPLTRLAWTQGPLEIYFDPLVEASAACLPFDEAFERAERALKEMSPKRTRALMHSLVHFKSARSLAWIEHNVAEPTVESWGHLAAASEFSWAKALAWLRSGRPLSLVAIDALRAIANPRTPFLRDLAPSLPDPPDEATFIRELSAYAEADQVPRVSQRVRALLASPAHIVRALS